MSGNYQVRGPVDAVAAAAAASPEIFEFHLYRYTPSLPAAAIAVVVFVILTTVHTWRIRKAGSVYFIPFTVGGLCMYKLLLPYSVSTLPCPSPVVYTC